MNQTEAWEAVGNAALEHLSWLACRAKTLKQQQEVKLLKRAIQKVAPRVQRMRARLDFSRARKAGKQTRPSWATP
jgi:hypothetical protein